MEDAVDDAQVLRPIQTLVDAEHRRAGEHVGEGAEPVALERLSRSERP